MKEKEPKQKWRRLDNSAKLFPIIANRKFSNVFRLSCVLKEEVEENILQEANYILVNNGLFHFFVI